MDDLSPTLIKTVIALCAIGLGLVVSKNSQRNWLGWITFFVIFFGAMSALDTMGFMTPSAG
ncbi:MAG: hypothetical protein REI95_13795 [Oxalicibacterium faecigallinarum]|uniref:hypothetical protein n=1 Tax=Oxalicibacterium faecigallinarum TaxID=573741 RepID=UPI002808F804|nr:hypothetical protein [Oxalicibacterium faecigallinarum]MDQ7970701.1 hypothetical protein [Oxalicibacterium faecigallinarum]